MYIINKINKNELDSSCYTDEVSNLVAAGFGRENDQAMRQDTIGHLDASPIILEARNESGELKGIAMARRFLW